MDTIDTLAADLADELAAAGALRYKNRVQTVAGLIAKQLRKTQDGMWVVHKVVDGVVQPRPAGIAVVRKVQP